MRVVIFALLASLALVSAIKFQVCTKADCTGDCTTVSAGDGECATKSGSGVSAKATCSGTNVTVTYYSNEDCSGDGTSGTVTSGECNSGTKITCGGCFAGDSVVTTPTGQMAFSELKVGDRVLAVDADGNTFFDKVFRRSSWHPVDNSEMIQLTTESGKTLKLTPDHYLHVNDCCDLGKADKASSVKVGDKIFSVNPTGELTTEVVAAVKTVRADGAYNVHTLNGNIVVNGIAATHFTTESMWARPNLAHFWYKAANMFGFAGAQETNFAPILAVAQRLVKA
jgi:hypothetical protein